MTFDQETWPRLRFQQNPLKVVVFQIRYATAYELDKPEAKAAIQRAVADFYPKVLDPVSEYTFAIGPQGPSAPQVAQTAIRFADAAEQSILAVGSGMASFETLHYLGWDEDFEIHAARLLDIVAEHGGPSEITRLGLRYVDELMVDGADSIADWSDLISERVLGIPDSLARDPRLIESDQRTTLRVDDDLIKFRHGFASREIEGVERSVYFLDTDISTIGPRPFARDELMATAKRYRLWARSIFGRSLTPAGIQRLGGSDK